MVGKAKHKPIEQLLPRKIVNQKQFCFPGGTEEMNAIIKDLRDAGVVIPTPSLFQFACLALEEDRWMLENDSGLP